MPAESRTKSPWVLRGKSMEFSTSFFNWSIWGMSALMFIVTKIIIIFDAATNVFDKTRKDKEMGENSQLLPMKVNASGNVSAKVNVQSVYHTPALLRESSISRLYRVSRAGKYFIIKTSKDSKLARLIKREYDLSIGLSHPYIINVFTYEEQTPVGEGIVMEYVDGRNLREFLRENPPGQLRERVLEQLLSAVSYLHSKGIIHNDLKPENILITAADNNVKLIDFGLSDNDAHYLYHTLGCTPGYASPELLAQEKTDSRSDIYALGLLMKELLPKSGVRIARKCLLKERDRRYANVDQVHRAFARRHYPAIILAILVCLASLIVSGFLLLDIAHTPNRALDRELAEMKAENAKIMEENSRLQEYKSHNERISAICDSVYRSIDQQAQRYVDKFNLKLAKLTYSEFGWAEVKNVSKDLQKIADTFKDFKTDRELYRRFSLYFNVVHNKCYDDINKAINAMPSFYKADISVEEKDFYRRLIFNNEPYRPYQE